MRIRTAVLVIALVLTAAPRATAEPVADDLPSTHVRLVTGPGELRLPSGKIYAIPQDSHIVTGEAWSMLDAEFRRLQEQEVRLTAENRSFRESADAWTPGWMSLTLTLAVGVALGWYVGSKL